MGGHLSDADLTRLEATLRRQWRLLRTWVGELDEAMGREPSVLDRWTVAELVAHLGRAMDALAAARPAPGLTPLTLGEYLGTYPERAEEIAATSSALAEEIRFDPLRAVDEMAAAAFAQVAALRSGSGGGDMVVQARRGPILLSEMILSRLIELVVHGDDLLRSLPRTTRSPLDPESVDLVAATLLEVLTDRGGWDLEVVDPIAWIRLAAGRVPFGMDTVSAALATRWTSDSLPDLGSRLPLL
ncbi:maleylpyruvate isomerase N-terminal domain-containing protein [Actinotalea sp.]|uniref:maleylpyruvate isomerase N-terminal domain-containing protein n=1 Tax=Actinotalea sp. TaxID=1872145 RepID=UPI003561C70B